MAENTLQYQWIVMLAGNLDAFLTDAFVAGDLFWYPVEGDPRTRVAPDVMVALGRPKGHRKSYRQWEENNQPPTVVFEIWSPSNSLDEQFRKILFYAKHGVEEFYTWDPDRLVFSAYIRQNGTLEPVATEGAFQSPRLGIRFVVDGDLSVYWQDGSPFLTFTELYERSHATARERDAAVHALDAATQERDAAAQERDAVAQRYAESQRRAESLAAKLRAMGIDPD